MANQILVARLWIHPLGKSLPPKPTFSHPVTDWLWCVLLCDMCLEYSESWRRRYIGWSWTTLDWTWRCSTNETSPSSSTENAPRHDRFARRPTLCAVSALTRSGCCFSTDPLCVLFQHWPAPCAVSAPTRSVCCFNTDPLRVLFQHWPTLWAVSALTHTVCCFSAPAVDSKGKR